jgi:pyruvate kinase
MHQGATQIWATIGPSTLNRRSLEQLEIEGVSLFRINLSHTTLEELPEVLDVLQSTRVPVCIDSEGAQLRTGPMPQAKSARVGDRVTISRDSCDPSGTAVTLNHPAVLERIGIGELLFVDDGPILQVLASPSNDALRGRVLIGGLIKANRPVKIVCALELPPLSNKDKVAIRLARQRGVRHFALSFAQSAGDVQVMREEIGEDSVLISKIESNDGLENLVPILELSDAILLDRGDLARDQPFEKIPFWQKHILKTASEKSKSVYVATNLLESMVNADNPTRAEVNDIANTLMDGAAGLVLAAETAVGEHPIRAVKALKRVIAACEQHHDEGWLTVHDSGSKLIEPYGGELSECVRLDPSDFPASSRETGHLLSAAQYADFLQLCYGGFSPLSGFMSSSEVDAVLSDHALGEPGYWPVPIVLQVPRSVYESSSVGEPLALWRDRRPVGTVMVDEKSKLNVDQYCQRLYRTTDEKHPGVNATFRQGEYTLAGKVAILSDVDMCDTDYVFSPRIARAAFDARMWTRIVGFHTRNIPHLGHELLQQVAVEFAAADGLYVSPVVRKAKEDDFEISAIVGCYEALAAAGAYGDVEVIIGALAYLPKFAGPREAILTAICRQNYGCSHFVIGRDHAGIESYYSGVDAATYYEAAGDGLGIELLLFDEAYFCRRCEGASIDCGHPAEDREPISGTIVREVVQRGASADYPLLSEVVKGALARRKVEVRQPSSAEAS